MTDNEIDAMPAGREMDALVAEYVMGSPCPPMPVDGPDWGSQASQVEIWHENLPHYSTDIAAAWQVVKKFNNKLTIQGPNSIDLNEGFSYPDYWEIGFHEKSWSNKFRGVAETAPLAICRAALKAVLTDD